MFPNANSSSSFIASVNIDNIRQRFPNSPTIKYYEKYNIEEALRNGILDNNPDIFFITDEEFSNAVKQDMESNGYTYNPEVSMPIIAVVESKNGPVVIGDRKYQPISIMSSTNHLGSAGSTHMAPIRNAAQSNTGTQLISINGKAIVTKAYGKPKAYSADINYRGRNNVTDIAINDLSQDERTPLESQNKKQRRRNPAYQKAKRNFLKGLGTKMIGGRKALVFNQPTLNGRFNQIEIFVSPINESTARNSDNTFEDEARDGDIINFNSRTSRAAKALENFVKSFNSDDLVYEEIDGQIVPTEATAEALQTMASNLQKKIDNFINIPIKDGWEYRITPISEVDGDNRIMDLSLVNSNTSEVIPLATFNSGMTAEDIKSCQEDFLKNLILDEGWNVRMTNANDSFAKWNVLYSDAEKTSESKAAADNISDIYEDGILGAAATTFNYRIQGIAVQNPFKADGTPAFTETANAVNAQPQQPITTPTIAEGQVKSGNAIVTDTGVILDGKPSIPTNPARERVAAVVEKIIEDSKHIEKLKDESGYRDTRTGKFLARVTSMISADEKDGERFDPNSPWVVPSTNIGTGFDEFVRDFFAGKLDNMTSEQLAENYPNATKEALQKFKEQLMSLRNNFISNGLTIIPRDVTVTGSLDVLDSNGKIHTVDVAGTLDLLAYDGNGNFFIFDMKTNRSGIDQHKQEKYSRQLSLYKKFLESKYGIQVKSLNLIPIGVEYPAPSGWKNGSADYSVSPEKANQLMIDGKNYTGANPTLQDTIAVNYTEPHIVWEKMTDEERAMFGEVENAVKAETNDEAKPTEAIPSEPSTETIDPILGTSFSDSYLGEMFGMDSTELNNFNMDITTRSTPIPEEYQWNNLTQEQREGIEMQGFNETSWSSLEDEEMKHKLNCLGL
ncbi:PD-(D/E)XK nuclease superfamily [Chlamydia trachomatis]|nr:PD-(D/E)XK nuclease superfamily [Chlamydia trachomatis]